MYVKRVVYHFYYKRLNNSWAICWTSPGRIRERQVRHGMMARGAGGARSAAWRAASGARSAGRAAAAAAVRRAAAAAVAAAGRARTPEVGRRPSPVLLYYRRCNMSNEPKTLLRWFDSADVADLTSHSRILYKVLTQNYDGLVIDGRWSGPAWLDIRDTYLIVDYGITRHKIYTLNILLWSRLYNVV